MIGNSRTGQLPSAASSTSISDILTAIKNIVTALNNASQTYLNVNGTLNAPNIGVATVVKTASGRIATISVLKAGTTPGTVYDGASLTDLSKPLGVIPNTVGVFSVNIPASFGILVTPGTGQTVTVGYS